MNLDITKVMIVEEVCLRKSQQMWMVILHNTLHFMDFVVEIGRTLIKMSNPDAMLSSVAISIFGMEVRIAFQEVVA